MTTNLNNTQGFGKRFEQLCERILKTGGYQVSSQYETGTGSRADFLISKPGMETDVVVEVKLYRSLLVDPEVLRNAARRLLEYKNALRVKSLFIANLVFSETEIKLMKTIGIDEVWGVLDLGKRAASDPKLATELAELLQEAQSSLTSGVVELQASLRAQMHEFLVSRPPPKLSGEELIEQFLKTKAGREDAKRFEELCYEAVKYLFRNDLGQIQVQRRIEEGFQYMDLIARIIPKPNGFWSSLAQDFRCRYVVFEFKNYGDEIPQNQIYLTEKYLYPSALRPVAIVIARNGSDSGAKRAVVAALRESGKVLLVLTLNDLFELLRAKDRGDEPADLLVDQLNSLLTSMAP